MSMEEEMAAMWGEWSETYLGRDKPSLDESDLEWAFKAGFTMGIPYGQTHQVERKVPMAGIHELDIRSAYPPESLVKRDEKRSYD